MPCDDVSCYVTLTPPELLALLRSEISTQAYGDLRSDTGVSMPNPAPGGPGRSP
jgi:hypothetical protein